MAGVVGYRKSAWDGATSARRAFLRAILNALKLGQPALYDNGSGQQWYVFYDARIDQEFVENLAWANTALTAITTEPKRDYPTTKIEKRMVPKRVQIDQPVLDENGAATGDTVQVWVDDPGGAKVQVSEEQSLGDHLFLASQAQGDTPWFAAATSLPDGWFPVEVV